MELNVKMEIGKVEKETEIKGNMTTFRCNLSTELLDEYRLLRSKAISFDAVLCCASGVNPIGTAYLHCHQTLLSVASPFFEVILKNIDTKKSKCPFILLPEIEEQDLVYILDYIYNSKVFVPQARISSFIAAAMKLQIRDIKHENAVTDVLAQHALNVVKTEQKVEENNNVIGAALSFNSQESLSKAYPNSLEKNVEETDKAILSTTKQDISKIKYEINNNLSDSLDPTNFFISQNGKSSFEGMKAENDIDMDFKLAKKPANLIGKSNQRKNTNIGKNIDKPQSKVENTEASNAVYREWKAKFSTSDDNSFNCHYCPEIKTFALDSSLRRHYKQSHEKPCKFCKLPFYDELALKLHITEYHEFRCQLCEKRFALKSSLKRHHGKEHGGVAV